MVIGILKEKAGETRVSMTPDTIESLKKLGLTVLVETTAGNSSQLGDEIYKSKGASIVKRDEILKKANIIVSIHLADIATLNKMKEGTIYIGMFQSFSHIEEIKKLSSKKVIVFSLDAIARITRAQSMDVLSSQSTVSGYKSVILAANHLTRFLPMLTTAAGTITPAKFLIIGAGVAGLQAIATAKRLGATVDVFDTRPEVKEQVQSLGAKFVDVEGATVDAKSGGYAVEQTEEYKKRQSEILEQFASKADVIITTALIPGRKAPVIITKNAVEKMNPGSVIVDLAAVMGGNCELTKNGKTIVTSNGVTIIGNSNLPGTVPSDASKMFGKNVFNFLKVLIKDKKTNLDFNDEVISSTCITNNGEILNKLVLEKIATKDPKKKNK